jgi:hypothetical protein
LSNRAANFVVADESNEVAVVPCDSLVSAAEAATPLVPEAPNFPG